MPVTYRTSKQIIPGLVWLNINRRSWSITVRAFGVGRTWSSNGRNTTSVDLPGDFGYRKTTTRRRRNRREETN